MDAAARQTAHDYFAATNRRDFRKVSELLYPGDLDKFKTNTLWCAQAMAPFGEARDFLKLFGPDVELEDLQVLSPRQFMQRFMEGAMGTVRPESWQAVVESFGVEATHQLSDAVAEVEYSYLAGDDRVGARMELQRIGDDWFVLLKEGFNRSNAKVRARVDDFQERSRRDRASISEEWDLEAFAFWGFRDSEGGIVIEPRFGRADDFSEGLAPVKYFNKWGYINPAGESVIDPRFNRAETFSEGLAAVAIRDCESDLRWGFIDLGGRMVIEPQFESVESFEEGTAEVEGADGRCYRIDRQGKFVERIDDGSETGEPDD